MTRVFISHSSSDREAAERQREILRGVGISGLFLDLDPVDGLSPGGRWEDELYSRIRQADAVILLVSRDSIRSPWCFAEVALARSIHLPVLPILLQPGLLHPLLADTQGIAVDNTDAAALTRWLQSAGFELDGRFARGDGRPPYPGLRSFTFEDSPYFFGRAGETTKLIELLTPALPRGAGRFIMIIGPSGSGKSSLLHAGLRPRLASAPQQWILLDPFAPGRSPCRRLALRLAQAFEKLGTTRDPDEIAADLRRRGARALVGLSWELVDRKADPARVLVSIDQAEELVRDSTAEEQRAFLSLVTGSLSVGSPVWVIGTMRSEYYFSTAPNRAGLASAVDDVAVIEPLDEKRLREVITQPAKRADVRFEDGLVEQILDDTGGGDALPLLAYTLRQLERRLPRPGGAGGGGSRTITAAAYAEIGGVDGALRDHADRLVAQLARQGYRDAVVPALLRLATVNSDEEPTRRRAGRTEFSPAEWTVIEKFADSSLLVTDHDPDRSDEVTAEVAHEALLRRWPLLRKAIEADRDRLRMRADLKRLAEDWQRNGRDDSYLLRGSRLARFHQWAADARKTGRAEAEFLKASRTGEVVELEKAERSYQRQRRISVALFAVLAIAISTAVFAAVAQQHATDAQRTAILRNVSAAADAARVQNPRAALQLALAAHAIAPSQSTQASLLQTLTGTPYLASLAHHQAAVASVAFAPDGSVLASAGDDGRLVLWDLRSRNRIPAIDATTAGHEGPVRAVAVSPRGHLLATGGADRSVQLWDYSDIHLTHRTVAPLRAHQGEVLTLAFSPDGSLLATGSDDSTVILWDVTNPAQPRPIGEPLRLHTRSVFSLTFSPDGRTLATGSLDSTVVLWDVSDRTRPAALGAPLARHIAGVFTVAFAPNGRMLATAGLDMTALLFDVTDVRQPRQLGAALTHPDYVKAVGFSPDSRTLATAGDDRRTILWDVTNPERPTAVRTLTGHSGGITTVCFAPDGRTLATASRDGTVVLWDNAGADQPRPLGKSVSADNLVWAMAIAPDGRLAVTGSDRDAVLWDIGDVSTPVELTRLRGHKGSIHGMAISPDGRRLATASGDWTIILWDISDRVRPRQLGLLPRAHDGWVNAVTFLGDGRTLASAGADSLVRLWDVSDPRHPAPIGEPLRGHTENIQAMTTLPGGRLIATSGFDRTIRLWDVSDPRRAHAVGSPFGSQVEPIYSMAVRADAQLLLAASRDKTVSVWDVRDPEQVHAVGWPVEGADRPVEALALSPDGRTLATGAADGVVRFFDVTANGEIRLLGAPLTGHHEGVRVLAFTPDGRTLLSGSTDHQLLRWDTGTLTDLRRDVVQQACRRAGGSLPPSAWQIQASGLPFLDPCRG